MEEFENATEFTKVLFEKGLTFHINHSLQNSSSNKELSLCIKPHTTTSQSLLGIASHTTLLHRCIEWAKLTFSLLSSGLISWKTSQSNESELVLFRAGLDPRSFCCKIERVNAAQYQPDPHILGYWEAMLTACQKRKDCSTQICTQLHKLWPASLLNMDMQPMETTGPSTMLLHKASDRLCCRT